MEVVRARSGSTITDDVVADLTADWAGEPDIVFVFCSTRQDPAAVARGLRERAGDALVVGCTTSGELVDGEHSNGTAAVAALFDTGIRWSARAIHGLSDFDAEGARALVHGMLEDVGTQTEFLRPEEHFALLFIDGMRLREESVAATLADALEGIPLAGGSAGDDLAFAETHVILGGAAHTDAAVVVLGRMERASVDIVKHQHFESSTRWLAVTRADASTRTVYELDGYPALEAYARALGLEPEEVDDAVTFLNPVTFTCAGERYVRSIQRVTEDGALVFYCAVEEGMVLEIGRHGDMTRALQAMLDDLEDADFVLAFNCILRSLEAESKGLHDGVRCAFQARRLPMIGFDTYGEQLNGLHINQTLVAVAFRGAA